MYSELRKELEELLEHERANGMIDIKFETSQTKENSTRELVWLMRNALGNFKDGNFETVASFRAGDTSS